MNPETNWRARIEDETSKAWAEFEGLALEPDFLAMEQFMVELDRTGLDPTIYSAMRAQYDWLRGDVDGPIERLLEASERRALGPYEELVLGLMFVSLELHDEAFTHLEGATTGNAQDCRLGILMTARGAQSERLCLH